MKTRDYLEAIRQKLDPVHPEQVTDYRVIKVLKVQPSLGYKYLRGKTIPGPLVAFRVAEFLGEQPAAVIADFEAERAERDGPQEDVGEWQRMQTSVLKRALGSIAASILLMAGSAGFSNAEAHLARQSGIDLATHRVKRRRQGPPGGGAQPAGFWDGLVRRVAVASAPLVLLQTA